MATTGMKEVVIVERLDGGAPEDPGCYRCTKEGCSWQIQDGKRRTPRKHVVEIHGSEMKLKRLVEYKRKGTLSEGERKARKAVHNANRRRKRKVSENADGGDDDDAMMMMIVIIIVALVVILIVMVMTMMRIMILVVLLVASGGAGCAVEGLTQMDITMCFWQEREKVQAESQMVAPMDVDDGGDDDGGYHKNQVSPTCGDVIILSLALS